ncbi:hypothetical protein NQ318_019898 [Aromia moschata]|uniref:Uncharacterized protein n=1 Tax=Aromia moschata TaxID=1265417 RepID=A0AAV8XIM8_9CUCU|nr:hypothetical protein NQ318_019898 [Aromia moschata]
MVTWGFLGSLIMNTLLVLLSVKPGGPRTLVSRPIPEESQVSCTSQGSFKYYWTNDSTTDYSKPNIETEPHLKVTLSHNENTGRIRGKTSEMCLTTRVPGPPGVTDSKTNNVFMISCPKNPRVEFKGKSRGCSLQTCRLADLQTRIPTYNQGFTSNSRENLGDGPTTRVPGPPGVTDSKTNNVFMISYPKTSESNSRENLGDAACRLADLQTRIPTYNQGRIRGKTSGMGLVTRVPRSTEDVLNLIEESPETSTRKIGRALIVSHSVVFRILKEQNSYIPISFNGCRHY